MKKKILALCLVVVLAVTAVTGVTLAYFTDSEQKTNVMAIGNVNIQIDELAYVGAEYAYDEKGNYLETEEGEFKSFKDNEFVLFPQKDNEGMTNQNKIVYTFNESTNEAAYIRTIILIEEHGDDCIAHQVNNGNNGVHHGVKLAGTVANVEIKNVNYTAYIYVAADEQPIPAGHSLKSLSSVWMKADTTNEEAAKFGTDGVNVLVYSQAVQSTNVLDHEEAMKILDGEEEGLNADEIATLFNGAAEATINDRFEQYQRQEETPAEDGEGAGD